MNFNEKLINLRKSKGLSQEELGAELKVSRQTISKWESCQSYPDFQRLVLLSDYFGLTLDELVKDVDVQEVREMVVCRCLPAVRRHMGAPSYHQNAGYCTMFSRHWQGPSPLSGRSRPRALTSPKGGAALWAAKPKNKGLPI